MKRRFEIEWSDENGPLWTNTSNLLECLCRTCRNSEFTVTDVTGDGQASETPESRGALGQTKLMEDVLGALARAYCHDKNSSKILDPDLLVACAEEVLKVL